MLYIVIFIIKAPALFFRVPLINPTINLLHYGFVFNDF